MKLFLLISFLALSINIGSVSAMFPPADSQGQSLPTLAPMLRNVNPAVVNISTYSTLRNSYNPLLNDPFFRHFFNIPNEQRYQERLAKRQQSAGSGVIINAKEGIVVTNFHVVKDASEVKISLNDGRSYSAKLRGADPDIDIAVLQIQAENLVEISVSNSDALEVGDFVLAIGNPFGLGQTVTTGIVSALGRSGLGIQGYENFIQTDASINPGNSGGALVNLAGELVGINTAIIAPSGGNVGIGFAIPFNTASTSIKQILEQGRVRRGNFGVTVQDINLDLRRALGLPQNMQGALISNVSKESTGYKSGLRAGDVIVKMAGQPIKSTSQFRNELGLKMIGDNLDLVYVRHGKTQSIVVEVEDPTQRSHNSDILHPLLTGIEVEETPKRGGVLVSRLAPNSDAAYSGLRPGDIIFAANRRRVTTLDSLREALKLETESILFQIGRNGGTFFLVIRS